MNTEQGVDVDGVAGWQELLADQDGADVLDLAHLMQEAPTEGLGAKLGALVDLSFGVLLAEPGRGPELADLLLPLAQRAVTDPDATYVAGRGTVAACTLLTQLGVDDPPADDLRRQVEAWLPVVTAAVDALQQDDRRDWGYICAAYGLDESVTLFADEGLARRLSEGAGASIEDVNAAWTSFVADFPAALETGSLRMSCLLHAGHAVYTRFGGHRPDQVLDAIRDFVRAGLEM